MSSPVSRDDKRVDLGKEVCLRPASLSLDRAGKLSGLLPREHPSDGAMVSGTPTACAVDVLSDGLVLRAADARVCHLETLLPGVQVALYPERATAVTASDTGALAWKGDLLALGVFEDAITPAGKGEGALSACASVSVDARGGLHPSKGCHGDRSAHLMYHKYRRLSYP